jgi:hypothetical protein
LDPAGKPLGTAQLLLLLVVLLLLLLLLACWGRRLAVRLLILLLVLVLLLLCVACAGLHSCHERRVRCLQHCCRRQLLLQRSEVGVRPAQLAVRCCLASESSFECCLSCCPLCPKCPQL